MRWTSIEEKEMIKEWAVAEGKDELTDRYLPQPDPMMESYWCECDEKNVISEYAFDSVSGLKALLERELEEEFYKDIILPVVIASFKEKKMIQADRDNVTEENMKTRNSNEFAIPEFVYVF